MACDKKKLPYVSRSFPDTECGRSIKSFILEDTNTRFKMKTMFIFWVLWTSFHLGKYNRVSTVTVSKIEV